jgi:hypothetical protein
MKYTVDMGSDAKICIPVFIKVGSGIRKLTGGGYTDTRTHRRHGDLICLLLFLKIRKVD